MKKTTPFFASGGSRLWLVAACLCMVSAAKGAEEDEEWRQEIETLKRQLEQQNRQLDVQEQKLEQLESQRQGGEAATSEDPNWYESLFGPKTDKTYFMPLDLMTPEFSIQEMKLKIGQLKDMKVFMGFQAETRLQALQSTDVYSNGIREPGLDLGFQTTFGDLSFLADLDGKIEMYFDLYLSSRPHPEDTYVYEWYDDFSTGNSVGGVDAWRDPYFHGIIFEASFSF